MLWVDHMFIPEGIRQHRQQAFKYNMPRNNSLKLISDDMKNCFVNGLPNANVSGNTIPNRIINQTHAVLQPIKNQNYSFIKIELNSYLANPN